MFSDPKHRIADIIWLTMCAVILVALVSTGFALNEMHREMQQQHLRAMNNDELRQALQQRYKSLYKQVPRHWMYRAPVRYF